MIWYDVICNDLTWYDVEEYVSWFFMMTIKYEGHSEQYSTVQYSTVCYSFSITWESRGAEMHSRGYLFLVGWYSQLKLKAIGSLKTVSMIIDCFYCTRHFLLLTLCYHHNPFQLALHIAHAGNNNDDFFEAFFSNIIIHFFFSYLLTVFLIPLNRDGGTLRCLIQHIPSPGSSPLFSEVPLDAMLKVHTCRITTQNKRTPYYTTLHYTALHYTTLHYSTLDYTTQHYTTAH